MAKPRVFIVEDHPVVRRGLMTLLEPLYDMAGSSDEAAAATEMILERRPDLVVLDVNIQGGGGFAVAEAVKRDLPDVKILVLSVSTSRNDVVRMFHAGIDGYIVKSSDEEALLDAVEQTLAGGRPISREIAGHLLNIDESITGASGIEKLTPKEREITTLIARGYTYREAASSLSSPISVKTLETHLAHIFQKLGVASRHEVTRIAYETGFVQPGPDTTSP